MADGRVKQDLQKEFADRVLAISRILPMLEPWDDPGYVKRAWCLFELYTSIRSRSVEIDIILSLTQSLSFRERINQDATDAHAVDGALEHVQSENAEASVQADLDAIRAPVQSCSGGFGTLNATIKTFLRRWFVSQGGVKVAARHGGTSGRANIAHPSGRPDLIERVDVARFAASMGPVSRGGVGSGGSTGTGPSATTAAAGDPVLSMEVSNPAHDAQLAYEDMRDPQAAITMARSPMARSRGLIPASSDTVGRSRSGGRRRSSEAAGLLGDHVRGRVARGIGGRPVRRRPHRRPHCRHRRPQQPGFCGGWRLHGR